MLAKAPSATIRVSKMSGITISAPIAQDVTKPVTSVDVDVEKNDLTSSPSSSLHRGGTAQSSQALIVDHERYPPPTEEERATLRKVPDSIPASTWALCIVELAERASYYGVSAVFNNYLQFPLPEGGDGSGAIDPSKPNSHSGALNLGLQTASAVGLLYKIFAYVIPTFGAWLADTKIGRFPAIVLVGGAAPALLKAGKGVAPFMVSFFLLGIGAGIFKPNIPPTVVDQYVYQREYTKVLKSGEKVLVDPETTINHILLIFNTFINFGAFFSVAMVYIEKYHGFWLAFLAPGIVYFLLPVLLFSIYKRTVRKKPEGSDLSRFVKITTSALKKSKGNIFSKNLWHKVKPSVLAESGVMVDYSEKNVSDVGRTWEVVQIFLYIPLWLLNDGGVGSVLSNQGASMTSNGAPSDLLSHFNSLTIIVATPFVDRVIYPFLRRKRIKFGRIDRFTCGFIFATLAGIIGAVVQYRVYETSPCGYEASTCDGVSPISIWWQIPIVSLGALSEVFIVPTVYELAYARAPENMRASVVAMALLMMSVSSVLGEILVPIIRDPLLVYAWSAPAIALFVQTILFVWRHRHINDDVFMTFEEDFEPVNVEKTADPDSAGTSE